MSSWVINSKPQRSTYEYISIISGLYSQCAIDKEKILGIVIGSVVPGLNELLQRAFKKMHPNVEHFYFADRKSPSPVKHSSEQLGTDLYANAVAAQALFPNKNSLIIDFGTALTLTYIDKQATLGGVIIAPGVKTALQSLVGNTAQLHMVALKKPTKVLGKHTEECIQSGMIYGFLSMVEGLIHRVEKERPEPLEVILTGGLSHLFEGMSDRIKSVDKYHTIRGLYLLYMHVYR